MDEFIHWSKPYLLLSTTCDEMLSWVIGIWMKNHSISDNKSIIPNKLQGLANNVGLTFSVGDIILRFTISIEQDS
jgi:hypothetical protein